MISKKQHELDLTKWYDSQNAGHDTCGSYDFCAYCNNEMENPCENALNTMNARNIKDEEEPAKKTAPKKATSKTEKAPAKKTTAKASEKPAKKAPTKNKASK